MAYSKQTWANDAAGGTPLSAARLNVMEAGIADAHTIEVTDARLSTNVPLISRDPATRPTTDTTVMVQFWTATQPTAMLTGDVWVQTA